MNLLVLAQTPPPLHGQSVMVQTMVDGFQREPGIELHHVNLRLSSDEADVGRWRMVKVWRTFATALRALAARFRYGCDTLYYVPAPAKRGALYRDWAVMLLCRPFFRRVVFHWHAAGLGSWLATHATPFERRVSQALLGRADLAIVLGENLRDDAAVLRPRQITVVRNGIADPCPGFVRPNRSSAPATRPLEAVFLGLCSRDKGLFAAIEGVRQFNVAAAAAGRPTARLSVAGGFADAATQRDFDAAAAAAGGAVVHVGFVRGDEKSQLLANADVLVFPTTYAHETQGVVVAEALAHDLPVIVTQWRAVHEGLPQVHVYYVEPDRPDQIADALVRVWQDPAPRGELRAHFLAHLTQQQHLARLRDALHLLA